MNEESTRQALVALELMSDIDVAIEANEINAKNFAYIKGYVIPKLRKIASSGKVAPKVVLDINLAIDKYELFCECQDRYMERLNALEDEYREKVEEMFKDGSNIND